jgi:hypothetical protein
MTPVVNSRTGLGAGIGAAVGFVFGGPLGAGVGAIVGGGIAHGSNRPDVGVMTPKRAMIFKRAIETVQDPEDLRKIADALAGEGCHGEAAMLRKRALLRELPPERQELRRAAFRKAMSSDDPAAIVEVAKTFHALGSLDAAKSLYDHADAVKAAHAAGKSAHPQAQKIQADFADKLSKAIIHFGPESKEAVNAATNLLLSRGKKPSKEWIESLIEIAAQQLAIEAPPAEAAPDKPIEVAVPDKTSPEATAAAAVEGADVPVGPDGHEPPAIGAPPGPIEPEVTDNGAPNANAGAPPADGVVGGEATP